MFYATRESRLRQSISGSALVTADSASNQHLERLLYQWCNQCHWKSNLSDVRKSSPLLGPFGSESHNKQLPKKQGALTGAPSTEMAGMKWSVVTVCRDTSTAPQHALLASFLTTEQLAPHLVTSPTGSTLHQMISTYIKCMYIYVHQIWSLQVQQLYKVVPHSQLSWFINVFTRVDQGLISIVYIVHGDYKPTYNRGGTNLQVPTEFGCSMTIQIPTSTPAPMLPWHHVYTTKNVWRSRLYGCQTSEASLSASIPNPQSSFQPNSGHQWIDLRENLQETIDLPII